MRIYNCNLLGPSKFLHFHFIIYDQFNYIRLTDFLEDQKNLMETIVDYQLILW